MVSTITIILNVIKSSVGTSATAKLCNKFIKVHWSSEYKKVLVMSLKDHTALLCTNQLDETMSYYNNVYCCNCC